MKYTSTITINEKRDTVVNILRSREDALIWMKGLEKFEHIEGEFEGVGSKYKMIFNTNGKKQEMIETISHFNPPKEITTIYEMGGVKNICINRFEDMGDKTIYTMDNIFEFPFFFGLFAWIFKGMFKKQTLSGMTDLKNHIESKKS